MVPITEPCMWFRVIEQQETNTSEFVYLVEDGNNLRAILLAGKSN